MNRNGTILMRQERPALSGAGSFHGTELEKSETLSGADGKKVIRTEDKEELDAPTVGTLYGVGVGPGDPELVTLKAYRLLKECPVIAYPAAQKGGKSYAQEIADIHVNAVEKNMLGLVFPMTKDPVLLENGWHRTVEQCWDELRQGKDIAFVTEGDPNLYSTFIHLARLMRELHPTVPVVSVPGISSVLGAAASLARPLAEGDQRVGIIPATPDRKALKEALLHHDTVVFLKVAKVLELVLDVLDELGFGGKASVVTQATSSQEMVWLDARELRGAELAYLSLMVVSK
ncbi:precorrin-2 C(20)-methyltransferase [Paenibacillus sp. M1]|uniref:Precorrin-2 C(20)-methyltransferase n=1 Tax=Paenibacillus haidiansis TaxID=1574488 RepID=A0ABU7VWR9_9BACL